MTSGRRLLVPLILAALVCAAATTGTAGTSSTSACRAGTKRAVIGGKVKCLKAGQSQRVDRERHAFLDAQLHIERHRIFVRLGRADLDGDPDRLERAPQVGLEPTTLRLTAGCSAN